MTKKLLSVALTLLAAVAIITAPIVTDTDSDAIKDSQSTTTTTTTTAENSLPDESASGDVTAIATQSTSAETSTDISSDSTDSTATVSSATTTTSSEATATTTVTTKKPQTTTTTTTQKPQTTTTTTTTTKKPVTTTTTTKKPDTPVVNNAPKGSPVATHGQLSVSGANIIDQNGNKFQLLGISTHGLGWFPDSVSKNAFRVFRDDWGCNAMRLAMYIEESWGGSESLYLAQPSKNYDLVTKGIDYCVDLGMYVVVDWHVLNPGDPTTHTKEAKEFFAGIAKEYGDCPNIIYEICNEPNGNVSWSGKVKPYAEEVIKEIRKYDSDAIIICGTPTWSQDIDKAQSDRLSDKNTVYALHFYANTHTDWLRNRLTSCYNAGLPVIVSEFGTCDASGNSGFNESQTKTWINLLNKYNIGLFNWSFCNKPETASILKSDVNFSQFKAGESQLTESGKLIRKLFRERAGL